MSHVIVYGISLTDEDGSFYPNTLSSLLMPIMYGDNEEGVAYYPPWIVYHVSQEYEQSAIGFKIALNKSTDFESLHQQWLKFIKHLPANIQDYITEHNIEADICIMSHAY